MCVLCVPSSERQGGEKTQGGCELNLGETCLELDGRLWENKG